MLVQRSLLMPHPAAAMFDVIEQAEHYPAFIPWCTEARILERTDELVAAVITMRVAGISLSLQTRNPKRRPHWLALRMVQGPLRRFHGEWNLSPLGDAACRIGFSLDYELGDALLERVAGPVFAHMADKMVDAYVRRVDALMASTPRSDVQVAAGLPVDNSGTS